MFNTMSHVFLHTNSGAVVVALPSSPQCCVFPAAVVLLESWHVLLGNLWDEHLNRSLILDLKITLNRIIQKNINTVVGSLIFAAVSYFRGFTL